MLGSLPGGIKVDLDTSNAIDSLRQDIGQRFTAVEDALRGDIRKLREEIQGELRGVREEVQGELRGVREEMQGELRAVREEMRGELRAVREEMRGEMRDMREGLIRHTMVLTESVRDDIRIVADGLAVVSAKLDALRR